eukprot:gene10665-7410_t
MAQASSSADIKEVVPPKKYVCIPGDAVLALGPKAVVGLGTGLYSVTYKDDSNEGRALVMAKYCAAVLKQYHGGVAGVAHYSQESPATRRYLCNPGDPVIGIVIRKFSPHYYYLYIGGTGLIYMDAMAFDGATKTSHPRLSEGSLVYGFIKQRDVSENLLDNQNEGSGAADDEAAYCGADSVDIELSCAASELGLPPKDWTSGEAIFGPLDGGRLLTVPLPYARSLLAPLENDAAPGEKRSREGDPDDEVPASYLVSLLGSRTPFEVCIGFNGMVWVKGQESAVEPSAGVRRTIAVSACIVEGQNDVTRAEMQERVDRYFPNA